MPCPILNSWRRYFHHFTGARRLRCGVRRLAAARFPRSLLRGCHRGVGPTQGVAPKQASAKKWREQAPALQGMRYIRLTDKKRIEQRFESGRSMLCPYEEIHQDAGNTKSFK